MKNKYEKLFDEFLNLTEFALVKGADGWSLRDLQGGNIGNIEQDVFQSAMEILDRMDAYILDYIANPLQESFEEEICPENWEELVNICRSHCPPLENWDVDVLDMICNHPTEIDLNNCFYIEEER